MAGATKVLVTAFVILTMLVGTLVVNDLVFALIAGLIMLRCAIRPGDTPLATLSPLVVLAIFTYGFVLAGTGRADEGLARQFFLTMFVLFLIYPVLWYDLDLDAAFKMAGVLLAISTIVFFAAVTTSQQSGLANAVLAFYLRNNLGFNAARDYLDNPLETFSLGTVSLLLLPFALFAEALISRRRLRDLAGFVLIFGTIAVSGSRGLLLTSLIALGGIVLYRARNLTRVTLVVLAVPMVAVAAAMLAAKTSLLDVREVSNNIKLGHLKSFIDQLDMNRIVFGDGLASYYFSSGREQLVAHTEITLLDMLRFFGFIITPALYLALLFPSTSLRNYRGRGTHAFAFFLLYLLLSMTNPVLFDAGGLLIVVWYWQKILTRPPQRAEGRRMEWT